MQASKLPNLINFRTKYYKSKCQFVTSHKFQQSNLTRKWTKFTQEMFRRPTFGACLLPKLFSSIKHTRSLRPSIKIGKEKFQLSVDVHHFNKDEIRVKAHPEYVVIEGKQEKDTQQGYVLRQFIRKFKLPEGCVPSKITCTICPDGMLTVEAPRSFKDATGPVDVVVVPISYGPSAKNKKEESIGPPPEEPVVIVDPCNNYPKVKPKEDT